MCDSTMREIALQYIELGEAVRHTYDNEEIFSVT